MLAGLEAIIVRRRSSIGERVVNKVAPRERDIAMVFQDYALYPQMTVFDNLAFGLRRRKVPARGHRRAASTEAARVLDIEPLLQRRPGQLSGGQAQRVALGRALVREPQVFLMDEPLSNLDAKLRTQTRGEIRRLQQEVRTTTVYVTHDQVEAMTMGDRIAVMNDGVLEQVGTPEELYERPGEPLRRGLHRLARDVVLRRCRRAVDVSLNGRTPAGVDRRRAPGARAAVARGAGRPAARARSRSSRRWAARRSSASTSATTRLVVFEEGRATRDVGDELEFGLVAVGPALLRRRHRRRALQRHPLRDPGSGQGVRISGGCPMVAGVER